MSEKEASKVWDRLEARLQGEKPKVTNASPPKKSRNPSKIGFIALAVVVVPTVLAIANIPYPVVRDPVIQTAPLLLLPSMISWDWQCSQAVSTIDKAESIIDQAKETRDLDSAKNLLAVARKHLDSLPAVGTPANHLWGSGMMSCPNRSDTQIRMQKLESMLTDEQRAQAQFSILQNSLLSIKAQYQQAQTLDLKKFEQGEWLSVLNRFGQMPPNTLAGRQAQAALSNEIKEFQGSKKLDPRN